MGGMGMWPLRSAGGSSRCSSVDESYRPETGAEDRLLGGERVAGAVQRRERTESERNRAQSSCITTRLTARHEKRRTGGGRDQLTADVIGA